MCDSGFVLLCVFLANDRKPCCLTIDLSQLLWTQNGTRESSAGLAANDSQVYSCSGPLIEDGRIPVIV